MTLMEQIQDRVRQLPPEKQSEVLDFITLLQQQLAASSQPAPQRSLRRHPAFGSWRGRKIDALQYEQALRAEWDR
jgi:hypothetical protein